MRSGIVQAGQSPWAYCSPGSKAKDTEDEYHQGEDADFYVIGFDLLTQVLRSSADHESCEKNSQDYKHQHPIQPGPNPSKDHLTQLYVKEGNQTAQGCKRVVHGVHCPARCIGRDRREQSGVENPEADFLALHISGARIPPEGRQPRVPGITGPPADQASTKE